MTVFSRAIVGYAFGRVAAFRSAGVRLSSSSLSLCLSLPPSPRFQAPPSFLIVAPRGSFLLFDPSLSSFCITWTSCCCRSWNRPQIRYFQKVEFPIDLKYFRHYPASLPRSPPPNRNMPWTCQCFVRMTATRLNHLYRVVTPMHLVRVHRVVSIGIRRIGQVCLFQAFVFGCVARILILRRVAPFVI